MEGLPFSGYPDSVFLETNDEDTVLKDDPYYVAARKAATGDVLDPPAWRSVVIRLTFKTIDGKEIYSITVNFAAEGRSLEKGRQRGWRVRHSLQLPRELPILDSYDLVMEVEHPSAYSGDRVTLSAGWAHRVRRQVVRVAPKE